MLGGEKHNYDGAGTYDPPFFFFFFFFLFVVVVFFFQSKVLFIELPAFLCVLLKS